jgi:hypothetical protein
VKENERMKKQEHLPCVVEWAKLVKLSILNV